MWALQQIPPQALNFNVSYTVPKASFLPKYVNAVTKDWLLNWFANYQSGTFLTPPTSSVNPNYLTSEDVRVPAQPLYTPGVNINNQSTYNPYYTQVLNPEAWAPCPSNAACMTTGNFIIAGFGVINTYLAPNTGWEVLPTGERVAAERGAASRLGRIPALADVSNKTKVEALWQKKSTTRKSTSQR